MRTKRSQSLKEEMLKDNNRKIPFFLRGATNTAKKHLLATYKENLVSDRKNLSYNKARTKKIVFIMSRMSLIYMICALLLFAIISFSLGMAYAMWILKNDKTIIITKKPTSSIENSIPAHPPLPKANKDKKIHATETIESLLTNGKFPKANSVIKGTIIMEKKSFNNDAALVKKTLKNFYDALHIKNKSKTMSAPYSLFLISSQDPQKIKKLLTQLKIADYNSFYQNNNDSYELYIGTFLNRKSADSIRTYLLSINIVAKTTFVEQ